MHESNPIAIVALPLGIGEARQRLKWACRSRSIMLRLRLSSDLMTKFTRPL